MPNTEDSDHYGTNTSDDSPSPAPKVHGQDKLGSHKAKQAKTEINTTKDLIKETRTIEWLQFFVNALLAAVGVVAVYIYHGQLVTSKQTLEEVARQYPEMQKQATAAQGQLAQAKADSAASSAATAMQVGIMQQQLTQQTKTMQMDERAWVGYSGLSEKYKADTVGQQIAGSVIINTGKTPARTVHAIIVIYERAASGYPTVVDESWMNNVIV